MFNFMTILYTYMSQIIYFIIYFQVTKCYKLKYLTLVYSSLLVLAHFLLKIVSAPITTFFESAGYCLLHSLDSLNAF